MKTVQKLEVGAGIITLIATLLFFFFAGFLKIIKESEYFNTTVKEELFWSFLILIIPSLLITFGSYFHASKQSKLGFAALIIGGSILMLYFGVIFFSGGAFYYYGVVGGFLSVIPGIFAAMTIILALRSRKSSALLD